MRSSSNLQRRLRVALLAAGMLVALGLTGCAVDVGGQTLPSPWYLKDDVQYFVPGPSSNWRGKRPRSSSMPASRLCNAKVVPRWLTRGVPLLACPAVREHVGATLLVQQCGTTRHPWPKGRDAQIQIVHAGRGPVMMRPRGTDGSCAGRSTPRSERLGGRRLRG